jgi:hypothetical protein
MNLNQPTLNYIHIVPVLYCTVYRFVSRELRNRRDHRLLVMSPLAPTSWAITLLVVTSQITSAYTLTSQDAKITATSPICAVMTSKAAAL